MHVTKCLIDQSINYKKKIAIKIKEVVFKLQRYKPIWNAFDSAYSVVGIASPGEGGGGS